MTPRIGRVGVLGHADRRGVQRSALALRTLLKRRGIETRFDARLGADVGGGQTLRDLARWCQILVTLGGDGTVLAGGRALAGTRGILLPINLGGLGFLTVADQREMTKAVRYALDGSWPVVARRMVSAIVRRRGRTVRRAVAMNDAVIKGAGGYAAVHLRIGTMGSDLEARGYEEIEARAASAYEHWVASEGLSFRGRDDADRLGDVVKFHWEAVAKDGELFAVGLNFLVLAADGRIERDYTFVVA